MIYDMNGKNRKMLRELKQNLKNNIEMYFSKKLRSERWKDEIKNALGENFFKLAELATLKFYWNVDKMASGYLNIGDINDIREFIVEELWKLITNKKFKKARLIDEMSTYNFFLMVAKQRAQYYIRRYLKRVGIMKFRSLHSITDNDYTVSGDGSFSPHIKWSKDEKFSVGEIVQSPYDDRFYTSITKSNRGNSLSDCNHWRPTIKKDFKYFGIGDNEEEHDEMIGQNA